MARRALGRRSGGIHDVAEIRQAAGMHILVLMRILIRIRMLDHPADRLRFLHDPRTIAFFQVVGDLHARSSWCASFGAEYNLGVRLIAIDGNASDIHVHGAHIESTDRGEVLHDADANGVVVARLFFASANKQKRGGESQSQEDAFHARVFSDPRRRFIRSSYAGRSPLGTIGRLLRRMPVASKMALPMAGATAMIGVSPAPAEGRSLRSSRIASISGTSRNRGTR